MLYKGPLVNTLFTRITSNVIKKSTCEHIIYEENKFVETITENQCTRRDTIINSF